MQILVHSSMPDFSGTPIHRKMREVQFTAGGRQIAPTFPIIDARIFGNAQSIVKRGRCNLPPEGGNLHRLFHSSMPDFPVVPPEKGSPLHKRFGSGSGSADSPVRYVPEQNKCQFCEKVKPEENTSLYHASNTYSLSENVGSQSNEKT